MRIREKMYELIIEYNSHYAVICDSCFSDTPEEHESKIYGLIDHLIANGVTIEAEPVRHGRWEQWKPKCIGMEYSYDTMVCKETGTASC